MAPIANVAFFSNQFARGDGTGVARYARGLVEAFKNGTQPFNLLPVATWSNLDAGMLEAHRSETGLEILPTGRIATRLLWTTIGMPRIEQLLRRQIDLVHTNDLDYAVPTDKPYAVTVHDIGPLLHPEYFAASSIALMRRNLRASIRRVDAFLCVSSTTAETLIDYARSKFKVNLLNRTHVTLEGISQCFFEPVDFSELESIPYNFGRTPFILAVGKLSPRKNIEIIIRALKRLEDTIPHHLLLVGGDGWDFESVKVLARGLELGDRVHFLGYVNDSALRALYATAALFIYPSLFEGFGLPVLEAMAAGCVVITSNLSSLPEVAGDAAILVDPRDLNEIVEAIETVCKGQKPLGELKERGLSWASRFTWEECAAKTGAVYEKLV